MLRFEALKITQITFQIHLFKERLGLFEIAFGRYSVDFLVLALWFQ